MDFTVKKSAIQGKGVFATRDFKKGETIFKWDTLNTLSEEEVKLKDKRYITFSQGKYIVMQEPEKFVNHSCDPNTEVKNFSDVAIKDIKEGEEITSDYSDGLLVEFECHCGSEECKKIIK